MDKIWVNEYDEGVPETIDPDKFDSLVDSFQQSCEQFKDNKALYNLGSTLTYGELYAKSELFARYLHHALKLQKGERIALILPNVFQYPIAMFGAFLAGLVVVNVNPLYTSEELEHQLKDADVSTVIVLANFAHTLAEIIDNTPVKHVILTELGDMFPWLKGKIINWVVKYVKRMVPAYTLSDALQFKEALQQGEDLLPVKMSYDRSDIAYLQYTGGTTGVAKGAVLTHRNMLANVEQGYVWMKCVMKPEEEIIITALPLYHIFSLTANLLSFMRYGALNILITNPRDLNAFVGDLKKFPFSVISGVNTLFNALLNHPKFKDCDFSRLKLSLGGGMAVQKSVAEKWLNVTKAPLLEAYGLTETSPAVTMSPFKQAEYSGSIGLPLPSTDIKILDKEGNELPPGEPGELFIKGPQVMREYWRKPEETKNVLSEDGWLRTGDVARVDERGYVFLVDRIKDMILVSGFNVYPNEVEEVLAHHEGVHEAGVVGVPNEARGELVKACIVKEDPNLTEEDVIAFCRQHLTAYKVPKIIQFVDELPKSNVGKILRRELRKL